MRRMEGWYWPRMVSRSDHGLPNRYLLPRDLLISTPSLVKSIMEEYKLNSVLQRLRYYVPQGVQHFHHHVQTFT